MTVLEVAYSAARVGVPEAGGAEQVQAALAAALVARGDRSITIAWEGSRVAGELETVSAETGPLDADAMRRCRARTAERIAAVLARERVDLVHLHGIDFAEVLPPAGPPVLVTLHLPPDWYGLGALRPERADVGFCCVSRDQERRCPPGLAHVATIVNGVPTAELAPGRRRGRFAVVLGRICPEKGIEAALDAAYLAGRPLAVAGWVAGYPAHQAYFELEIEPRLDRARRFVGPVGPRGKRRLLASAHALVVPSRAPETSSLVAMEALACGTPVIAFPAGALPEIVDDGVTGFLVDDVAGIAAALERVDALDRAACRRIALERFDAARMQRDYLALYDRLAGGAA